MEDKSLGPKTSKRRKVEASKKRTVQSSKMSEDAADDGGKCDVCDEFDECVI